MSTRGLLGFRVNGQDYITYNHSDSYPQWLGMRVVQFAHDHLHSLEAIQAFGRKIEALGWDLIPREARSAQPQGPELLAAIAEGRVLRVGKGRDLFHTCLDCEFAYVLDLDEGQLEFWDLPDLVATFPLLDANTCNVDVMECERRR